MGKRTVIVNDKMQKGYRYRITEPAGRNFPNRPQLKPKEMLARLLRQVHDRYQRKERVYHPSR
jgi:hypothetical protein